MTTKDKTTNTAAHAADITPALVKVRVLAKSLKFDSCVCGRGSSLRIDANTAEGLTKSGQVEIIN